MWGENMYGGVTHTGVGKRRILHKSWAEATYLRGRTTLRWGEIPSSFTIRVGVSKIIRRAPVFAQQLAAK